MVDFGQIVYFLRHEPITGSYIVEYGEVAEIYRSEIYVLLYEVKKTQFVNGIDSKDIPVVGEWRKLPRNWITKQDEMLNLEVKRDMRSWDIEINSISSIRKAIDDGVLVHPYENDNSKIELEVGKEGYRIVKKPSEYHPSGKTLFHGEYFTNYLDAAHERYLIYEEMERQQNLTDEEWSIEQIDKTLERYKDLLKVPDEEYEKIRNKILSLENIKDVEIRLFNEHIQWKYWKQKRWKEIS